MCKLPLKISRDQNNLTLVFFCWEIDQTQFSYSQISDEITRGSSMRFSHPHWFSRWTQISAGEVTARLMSPSLYLDVLLLVPLFKAFVQEHVKAPPCISRPHRSYRRLLMRRTISSASPHSSKSLRVSGDLNSGSTQESKSRVGSRIRPGLKAEWSARVRILQTPSTVNM